MRIDRTEVLDPVLNAYSRNAFHYDAFHVGITLGSNLCLMYRADDAMRRVQYFKIMDMGTFRATIVECAPAPKPWSFEAYKQAFISSVPTKSLQIGAGLFIETASPFGDRADYWQNLLVLREEHTGEELRFEFLHSHLIQPHPELKRQIELLSSEMGYVPRDVHVHHSSTCQRNRLVPEFCTFGVPYAGQPQP